MNIEATKARHVEHGLRQDQAIGRNDHHRRTNFRNLCLRVGVLQGLWLKYLDPVRHRHLLDSLGVLRELAGAVRDIEKWPARDRRTIRRDVINFEEYNPYITSGMLRAVDTLHAIAEEDPDAPTYVHQKAIIRAAALKRGIGLYNRFIVAALGAMLDRGESAERYDGSGRWLDIAGQYITKREVEAILDAIDHGELASPEEVDNRFRVFFVHYDDYAHSWAEGVYASLLGHIPTVAEIEEAIAAGRNARATMRRTTDADRDRDCSLDMAVSYGLDSDDEGEVRDDYYSVRGLK